MILQSKLFKTGLFFLLSILHVPVSAQNFQLAGFSFTRMPGAQIIDSPENQVIKTNEYNFFVNIPLSLKNEKTIFINGIQYKAVTPFSENDLISIDGQNLHLISYRFTVVQAFKKNWLGALVINPTLSSTFNSMLERDDLIMSGAIQFSKQKSDNFSYGFGIARTTRFGELLILPTLDLTKKFKKSTLRIALPRHVLFDYNFGKVDAGFQVALDGSEYNVNHSELNEANEGEPVDKFAYSRILLGPKIGYHLKGMIRLEVSGGIVSNRSIELNGELFRNEIFEVAGAPFFQFGIVLIPPKK